MKKELFLFVFLSVFITLIDLGAQIRAAQTRYTVVNFGLNQPLTGFKYLPKTHIHSSFLPADLKSFYSIITCKCSWGLEGSCKENPH